MNNLSDRLHTIKLKYIKLKSKIIPINKLIDLVKKAGGETPDFKAYENDKGEALYFNVFETPESKTYLTLRLCKLKYINLDQLDKINKFRNSYFVITFLDKSEIQQIITQCTVKNYNKIWWISFDKVNK